MKMKKSKQAAGESFRHEKNINEPDMLEQLRRRRFELLNELREVDSTIRELEQLPSGGEGEPLSFDEILPGFSDPNAAAAFEMCRHLLFAHEERLNEKVEKKNNEDFNYKLSSRWYMLLKFSRYYFDIWANPKFRLHERLPDEMKTELNLRKSKNRGWEGVRLSTLDQVRRLAPYMEKHADN